MLFTKPQSQHKHHQTHTWALPQILRGRYKSRTGSTRTASPRRINSDRLGPTRIKWKNKNKIKMDSDHKKKNNSDYKKKNKISRYHLSFTRHFVFFLTNSWLRKLILFLFLLILMIHQWAAHIHFQCTFSTWKEEKSCSPGTTRIFVPRARIELTTLRILHVYWMFLPLNRRVASSILGWGHENFLCPGRAWFLLLPSWKCSLEIYVCCSLVYH